jgi:hypothetical protein
MSVADSTCTREVCETQLPPGVNGYCSEECKRISNLCHSARLPALEEWNWLPREPNEVRIRGPAEDA